MNFVPCEKDDEFDDGDDDDCNRFDVSLNSK
jgi:hypothetical protein